MRGLQQRTCPTHVNAQEPQSIFFLCTHVCVRHLLPFAELPKIILETSKDLFPNHLVVVDWEQAWIVEMKKLRNGHDWIAPVRLDSLDFCEARFETNSLAAL